MRRGLIAFILLTVLSACSEVPLLLPEAQQQASTADSIIGDAPRHIVRLHEGVRIDDFVEDLDGLGIRPHHLYRHTINGFAAPLTAAQVEWLRASHLVLAVIPDAPIRLHSVGSWGIDRTDQRALPLDGSFDPGFSGQSVRVYIVDSGVMSEHEEFQGRVLTGDSAVSFDAYRPPGNEYYAEDCWGQDPGPQATANGHGTHVAGTTAGSAYGLARSALVVSVRVMDCQDDYDPSGRVSDVIAGVDWISGHFLPPGVVNMSLGAVPTTQTLAAYEALEASIAAAVGSDIPFIVSAGNDGASACDASPARMPEVITVGSTDSDDAVSAFSNQGDCVDLFAPGAGIVSAFPTTSPGDTGACTTCTYELIGTSMAAPHVTGVVAHILEADGPSTPAEVRNRVLEWASGPGLSSRWPSSPDRLVFTPQVVTADVLGPSSVAADDVYSWYGLPAGGTGTYSYTWSHRFHFRNGQIGSWSDVGSDSTLTWYVTGGSSDFELRLRVDSDSLHTVTHQYVVVPEEQCQVNCIERAEDGDAGMQ